MSYAAVAQLHPHWDEIIAYNVIREDGELIASFICRDFSQGYAFSAAKQLAAMLREEA